MPGVKSLPQQCQCSASLPFRQSICCQILLLLTILVGSLQQCARSSTACQVIVCLRKDKFKAGFPLRSWNAYTTYTISEGFGCGAPHHFSLGHLQPSKAFCSLQASVQDASRLHGQHTQACTCHSDPRQCMNLKQTSTAAG